jgi:hypothetical protein
MKKNTNLKHLLSLTLFLCGLRLLAQVPQKVVVEHFTNTVCSVCASRNPGFYTNLNNQTDVLHVAIHPSAPYASCVLNQQNKVENDARTRYYGIYGSTPRFVIQGNVVPSSTNINVQALFDPYLLLTSPLTIRVAISESSATELMATIVVKTVATHSLGSLLLTASAVEETLNYVSPNGEQVQHDVFRKSFFDVLGKSFMAPVSIGDSLIFTATVSKKNEWAFNQLYALVMVQDSTSKNVIQAERSPLLVTTTGLSEAQPGIGRLYPNPVQTQLFIKLNQPIITQVQLFDITGNKVMQQLIHNNSSIDISALPNGLYLVVLTNQEGISYSKITKTNE